MHLQRVINWLIINQQKKAKDVKIVDPQFLIPDICVEAFTPGDQLA